MHQFHHEYSDAFIHGADALLFGGGSSLEQLCINFANESLQMLFNQKVLESDKSMYEAEFEAHDLPEVWTPPLPLPSSGAELFAPGSRIRTLHTKLRAAHASPTWA